MDNNVKQLNISIKYSGYYEIKSYKYFDSSFIPVGLTEDYIVDEFIDQSIKELKVLLHESIHEHKNLEKPKTPLTLKEQIRCVKYNLPDVWKVLHELCPTDLGLTLNCPMKKDNYVIPGSDKLGNLLCANCWHEALEGDDK